LKRRLLHSAFFFSFILLAGSLSGQIVKGTAIAGMNLTQVEGDEIKGWNQIGFTGGLGAIVPFGNGKWGANIETLFSQKGSFQKKQYEGDSLTGEYRLRLNYLEIPLYATFTDKDIVTFGAGGYWGFLFNAREEEHSGRQDPYTDTVQFNNSDIGFLLDFRVRIWNHLHINVRYSQSLASIRTRWFYPEASAPFERDQFNQAITFRVVYIFNEGKREDVQGR